jgi:hypothetical protein
MELVALFSVLATHVLAPAGNTADVGELPYTLVAVTVKVYEVPFVSPVTVQVKAPVVVQV